jgi:hypothetical protein
VEESRGFGRVRNPRRSLGSFDLSCLEREIRDPVHSLFFAPSKREGSERRRLFECDR